jgi:hypothetical protein
LPNGVAVRYLRASRSGDELRGSVTMKTKKLILKDVPRLADLEINKAIIDYSVALCRIRGDDPATFTPPWLWNICNSKWDSRHPNGSSLPSRL